MKILNALANTLLGLLLLLSLVVLSLGVSLNATVLSSAFINKQLDTLPITALVDDAVKNNLDSNQAADIRALAKSAQDVLARHEGDLKKAAESIVSDLYGYLVDGRALDFEATLRRSVLDPKLANAIIDEIDLTPVVNQVLSDMVPPLPGGIDPTPYLSQLVPVATPWLKAQLKAALPAIYDYLLESQPPAVRLELPVGPVLDSLRAALREAVLKMPPAPLAQLPQATIGALFDAGWQTIAADIPVAYEMNLQEDIGQPGGLVTALNDAKPGLATAHQVIGYYRLAFWLNIALALLLMAGIFLLNRPFSRGSISLGVGLLVFGVPELAGLAFSFSFWQRQAANMKDIPAALQPWLMQLGDSVLKTALIVPIICVAVGVVLIGISFFVRRSERDTGFAAQAGPA